MPQPRRLRLLRPLNRLLSRLPLRAVLIIPFVALIVLVAGLIGFLSFWNGVSAIKTLANQLEIEVGQRVEQTLETYLKMPQLAVQASADVVRQDAINPNDLEVLQEWLWNQFRQFNDQFLQADGAPTDPQPNDLSFVGIGTEQGNYADVGYNTNGLLTKAILDRQTDTLKIWQVDRWGNRLKLDEQVMGYDPRGREWYQRARQAGRLIWVGPYSIVGSNDFVISADQPLFDRRGNLVGVADATLSLRALSRFLASLQIGKTGQIFITDLQGSLLATSTEETPFEIVDQTPRSIRSLDSSNSVTRDTASFLKQQFRSFDRISAQQQQPLVFRDSQGREQFVRVESFRSTRHPGIDWLVVIAVPADDFMGQIRANTAWTALLCLLGSLGAITFGIAAGRWLTRPIVQLSRAADAMAQGDWERPVTIQRSGELGLLVNAFNHMRRELRHSQQQLKEYSHGLEQKNAQLETLETELRRQLNLFLHAVSHDLRNPVLGLSMVLNNLGSQAGDEIKLSRQILERMQESNKRQLELINSLIDTHASEMWGIALHLQPVDLRPLVETALADLQPLLEKEQAHLHNQIDPALRVSVDSLQLGRVYQNLIANALKHNPTGLTICLTAQFLADRSQADQPQVDRSQADQLQADQLYCTVSDDGVGIEPAQRERLFDPYFRGSAKPKSVGLGLGLYLCQQIIQAHGGQIGVESQVGKGTTFWFTLPLGEAGEIGEAGKIER